MTDSVRRYVPHSPGALLEWDPSQDTGLAVVIADDYDKLAARLAAREAECRVKERALTSLSARLAAREAEVARAHAAETLADERWMRDGELRDAAEAERDSLRDKLAKLEAFLRHHGQCASRVFNFPPDGKTQGPCNCGLAALQSSEKGL